MDNDGFIWISDWYLNAIIKIDQEGNFIGWLGRFSESEDSYFHQDKIPIQSSAYGGFFKPHMIAFDESNNIYVIETGNNRLQKFDSNFNFIGWIGFDSTSNASLDGWSRQGIAASSNKIGGFSNPTSIRIFNNKIYVADNGNNRIQRFKLDGTFDGWIGGTESEPLERWRYDEAETIYGAEDGFLASPFDVILSEDNLLIADGHNSRVIVIVQED